ncbi:MAG: isopentenyl-diphosphate Delta-isomerase [Bacteroidetes bacterium]|nr:MAG: isopentenyl-diphosphate Delta-isomerase [Bacteroidota bacterium]
MSHLQEEQLILVDREDREIGTMPKMEAHRKGLLHRAFSVFVFNERDELLIHQRAKGKYHSPGLWTNTCCSHPRKSEGTKEAAKRRLMEEMGFECELKQGFSFIYRADLGNGLIEHELDHVFVGRWNGVPAPNAEEVAQVRWLKIPELLDEIQEEPERYTYWFREILGKYRNELLEELEKLSENA